MLFFVPISSAKEIHAITNSYSAWLLVAKHMNLKENSTTSLVNFLKSRQHYFHKYYTMCPWVLSKYQLDPRGYESFRIKNWWIVRLSCLLIFKIYFELRWFDRPFCQTHNRIQLMKYLLHRKVCSNNYRMCKEVHLNLSLCGYHFQIHFLYLLVARIRSN